MKHSPIKVAILLQDLEFGGTQRHAVNLLTHLDREMFAPELWLLRGGTDMLPLAEKANVNVVWMSKSLKWVHPGALLGLLRQLRRSKPDVLYTLTVIPNIWGRVLGSITGVPAIVSSLRNGVAKQHDRWLWPLSKRIICNAESLRTLLIERHNVDPARIAVIPNGVDTDFFAPNRDEMDPRPTAIFVGRLVEQKDPITLLDAFRMTLESVPTARLIMVGNGHLRPQVDQYIRSHSLEESVTAIPGTADIRPLLNRAWVFVLSSVFEGSPNVMIEAMSSGLPVISTAVDGIPEVLEEGVTGLLAPPGDPRSLANALTRLLSDRERCCTMGAQARERILHQLSLRHTTRMTEQVFKAAFEEHVEGNCA
jgi:glycosyltransferase involved in cell wall biosynthesis